MQKESAGMRQSVITKAPPAVAAGMYPQYAMIAFGAGTIHLRDPMTQNGWAFQCTQLFKGLTDEGHPQYEDWREYVSHIEQLYALRTNGCTGHAFRKACDRSV